jgi:chromosome segregation ATPase
MYPSQVMNAIQETGSYRHYPQCCREYWILVPAKSPIQHTMMNAAQIVDNARHLEKKIDEQQHEIASLRSSYATQIDEIEELERNSFFQAKKIEDQQKSIDLITKNATYNREKQEATIEILRNRSFQVQEKLEETEAALDESFRWIRSHEDNIKAQEFRLEEQVIKIEEQDQKIAEQDQKIAEQAKEMEEMKKKLEEVTNVVYQFIGGLYCQRTQGDMIDAALNELYGESSPPRDSKGDSKWTIWPTTRQGDDCERRIEALEKKMGLTAEEVPLEDFTVEPEIQYPLENLFVSSDSDSDGPPSLVADSDSDSD